MKYQELINKNIKELRVKNNLTQEEFSEKIGISIQGLSNIERNRYQPNSETVDKICNAFKITPSELLLPNCTTNQDVIANLTILLSQYPHGKLNKIYEVIRLLAKL